jgi:hypothetical protein
MTTFTLICLEWVPEIYIILQFNTIYESHVVWSYSYQVKRELQLEYLY